MRRAVVSLVLFAGLLLLIACRPGVAAEKGKDKSNLRGPDVVYVPTPHDVADKMLKMAGVTKDDVLYEPGCGDGRIMIMAARKYGCKTLGVDLDPERVRETQQNAKKSKVEHLVTVDRDDIYNMDFTPASVVALYLLPSMNKKLIPQLVKLKPGSRIVAHDYPIPGIPAEKTSSMISNEDNVEHTLFLWTTPLKVPAKKAEKKGEKSADKKAT